MTNPFLYFVQTHPPPTPTFENIYLEILSKLNTGQKHKKLTRETYFFKTTLHVFYKQYFYKQYEMRFDSI